MNPKLEAEVEEPAFVEQVTGSIGEKPTLARGLARSYGDASLNEHVISTLRLNRIIHLDETTGEIECEAGTSLADIIDLILPAGWFLPVTPGTKFITVGGAIASDVHGKNHHVDGCFSEHLVHLDISTGNGTLRCSSSENADLFYQTVGGMGLSGVIVSARFRLKKVETAYIIQERIRCKNLDAVITALKANPEVTYSVAWTDVGQTGKSLGRSVLLLGEHAKQEDLPSSIKDPLKLPAKKKIGLPFNFPSFTINGLSIKIFNLLFYMKNGSRKSEIIDLDTYFYPLDSVNDWNRVYGKTGFTQYQFVIPMERGEEGLLEILQYISESKYSSFLSVLKLFGKSEPKAIRSFPKEGYTLTIDVKVDAGIQAFIDGLDDLVEKHNGKVYLAKDAFSRLGKKQLPQFDGHEKSRFESALIRRLRK